MNHILWHKLIVIFKLVVNYWLVIIFQAIDSCETGSIYILFCLTNFLNYLVDFCRLKLLIVILCNSYYTFQCCKLWIEKPVAGVAGPVIDCSNFEKKFDSIWFFTWFSIGFYSPWS